MPDFIRLEDVSFSYKSDNPTINPTLNHVNFKIEAGEFVALIGSNGSGKSTLAKLLTALMMPDNGKVISAGLDTREVDNQPVIRRQVGIVFQQPQDQVVATTVEEDVAFGPGNLGLPPKEVRQRVEEALAITGISDLRGRPSFRLSAGETQRLALAGILAMRPRCVIFDETTAMLDPIGRKMVLKQAKLLNEQGITILFITHLMQEAANFDRIIVMHQGQLLMDESPANIFSRVEDLKSIGLDQPETSKAASRLKKYFPGISSHILEPYLLIQSLPNYQGNQKPQSFATPENNHPLIIKIENLYHTYMQGSQLAHQAIENLDLNVYKGNIHSLIGVTGSGKSTVMQHINGLLRPQKGNVSVIDFKLNDKNIDIRSLRRKVAMAFQRPENQIFKQYVGDEIAYGPRLLGFKGKLSDVVEKAMDSVGIDFASYKDRLTSNLSGGEQRKVALASVLAVQPEILLLDEPLSGLDPYSAKQLIHLLERLNKTGKTIVISTHQYNELLDTVNQVSVIHDGKDMQHGNAELIFGSSKSLNAIGLSTPLPTQIADGLREKGWPLSPEIGSLSRLEMELAVINK